jgi:ADP-heptose:LPS heptosyltransferase
MAVPDAAVESASRLLAESGIAGDEPFILLAPGASCAARRYSAERFGMAAAALSRATGLPVVLAGAANEEATVARAAAAMGECRAVSLTGRTSVPELAGLISRAHLLLANDSGPMHMADALGTPMVILFAGTDLESQWRPRTAPAVLLRRPTACAPCYRFECPTAHECLDIPPEEVEVAVRLVRLAVERRYLV